MAQVVIEIKALADKAQAAIQGFTGSLDKMAGKFSGLNALAARLGTALSAGAVALFTKRAIDSADAVGKLSQKVGVSTETLSGWTYAAKLSDVSAGELEVGMRTLANTIAGAARGEQMAAQTLAQIGLSATDARGRLRSLEEMIPQIADKFADMADGVEKTELAMALFGRSGVSLIPMLNGGASGLAKMAAEARAAGLEISGSTAKAAEDFNDNLTRLAGVAQGFGLMLAEALLPHLQSFTEWLLKLQRESGVFSAISETLKDTLVILGNAVDLVWTILNSLAILLGAGVAMAVETFLKGVDGAVSLVGLWIDSLKGLLEMLKGVAMNVLGVGDAMRQLKAGDLSGAWETLKTKVAGVGDEASKLADRVAGNTAKAAGVVADLVSDSFASAKAVGEQAINDLAKAWGDFDNRAAKRLAGPLDTVDGKSSKPSMAGAVAPNAKEVEAARAKLAEIEAAHRQAVLGRKLLLDQELEENIARLNSEAERRIITEDQALVAIEQLRILHSRAIEEIEKEEAARREARERNEASAKAARDAARAAFERRLIELDPDLSRAARRERLLELMGREDAQLQRNLALQMQILEQEGISEERRINAETQINELMMQRAAMAGDIRSMQDADFTGTMRTGLRQLSDEWTNFGVNAANVLINGVQRSVEAVSDSIMGLIDGTTTWGEAFANVARQIVADIIRIIVQWVAGKLIMIAMEKIFGKTVATTTASNASQAAAAWAPAAVSASIASYGAAATLGTAAYIGALAAGTAVSAGISAGAGGMGFEDGGLIPPGRRTITVNEAGQEAVVNARGLRNIGPAWINAINAGLITARDLEGNVTESINGAVPGMESGSRSGARGMGSSSGRAEGGRTIELTIVVANDRPVSEVVEEVMASARGEVIVVDHTINNKLKIGIPT